MKVGRINVRLPHVEDLLVYKLLAARPRDVDDARELLRLHGEDVDRRAVKKKLEGFAAELEDDESVRLWKQLTRRR